MHCTGCACPLHCWVRNVLFAADSLSFHALPTHCMHDRDGVGVVLRASWPQRLLTGQCWQVNLFSAMPRQLGPSRGHFYKTLHPVGQMIYPFLTRCSCVFESVHWLLQYAEKLSAQPAVNNVKHMCSNQCFSGAMHSTIHHDCTGSQIGETYGEVTVSLPCLCRCESTWTESFSWWFWFRSNAFCAHTCANHSLQSPLLAFIWWYLNLSVLDNVELSTIWLTGVPCCPGVLCKIDCSPINGCKWWNRAVYRRKESHF